MKDIIVIEKTDKCDSRTLKPGQALDIKDVESDTKKHIEAVNKTVKWICDKAIEQVKQHDWTKLGSNIQDFRDALASGDIKNDDCEWYKMHVVTERHHLKSYVPDDVNIVDLIEMICDCVCAGKARTGDVYPLEIPSDTLQKIVNNTVELLKNHIEVKE